MLINKNQQISLYLLCFFSLTISLIIEENSSGGSKLDSEITRQFVDSFSINFSYGIEYFVNSGQVQSPIFYIVLAYFEKILGKFFLKYFYLLISALVPIVFYTSLKKKFQNIDKNYLFLISLIIFLSPFFRSSAVWMTTDNLAILFYILSISKYLSLKKSNSSKNIILCLIYLSLAVYIRQYYIIFFLFFFIKFRNILSLKKLFIFLLFEILIFLPLIWYYYYFLEINFSGLNTLESATSPFKLNYFKNLLIFLSLYFFYTIPLYTNIFLEIKKNIINYFFFILVLFLIFLSIYFTSNLIFDEFGGGFFVKASRILNRKELFFIASFVGALLLCKNMNTNNIIVYICLILAFPTAIIYQKYYDPLLILTIFTITEKDKISELIQMVKINLKFLYLYFFSFLILCNLYYLYKI